MRAGRRLHRGRALICTSASSHVCLEGCAGQCALIGHSYANCSEHIRGDRQGTGAMGRQGVGVAAQNVNCFEG